MLTERMKPISWYIPITRVNEEERIAEGYAFVNEVVEGEGGLRLKRTAMEEATPDYLQWGAVRAMHQPIAAGTATGVEWDDQGAFLRAKIVDDSEWAKVKEGVYKGFSVGVAARLMRGKNVEKCTWIETSLVDRPKDPGAVLTSFRMEGAEDEYDCEVEDETPIRRSFVEKVEALQKEALMDDFRSAWYCLQDCIWSIHWGYEVVEDKRAAIEQNIAEFTEYLLTCLDKNAEALRGQMEDLRTRIKVSGGQDAIERLGALESKYTALERRAETAEADLTRAQGALATAEDRVRTLEQMPTPSTRPIKYPAAGLERHFSANDGNGQGAVRSAQEEIREIIETARNENDPVKREQMAHRLMVLQAQIG